MSIGEAAREKIAAFAAGETEEAAAPDDTLINEGEQSPGSPESLDVSESATADETLETVSPTEEEEEAAEEAADAAADALPDDATDEEREAARQAARDEFFLGTYRSREDAEKGLAEKDETLKRLFSEKNLLEQRLKEVEERRQEEEAQPAQLDIPAWEQWAADQVLAGAGEQGAMAALREGGYDGYQVYMRHWLAAETPDGEPDAAQRAAAMLYNNEVIMQIAEVRAAAASAAARNQPTAAEAREQAYEMVRGRRSDFDEYADAMTETVSELPQSVVLHLRSLAEQGVEGQANALEWIYLEAKAKGPSKSERARRVERQRRKASAAAATVAATSVSAEGTSSRTPPPAAEAEGIRRKQGLRARQNLRIDDGLADD